MSDQVWCVSSGEWSDYYVDCCFTTRALAVEYAARRNEWTVNDMDWYTEMTKECPGPFHYPVDPGDRARWDQLKNKTVKFYVETFQLWDVLPVNQKEAE